MNTGLVRRLHFSSPDNVTGVWVRLQFKENGLSLTPKSSHTFSTSEFSVSASYRGQGQYHLSVEEGEGVSAAGRLEWEGQEGGAGRSLRLRGTIGDRQVSADVAVVEETIHVFTRVSPGLIQTDSG